MSIELGERGGKGIFLRGLSGIETEEWRARSRELGQDKKIGSPMK